MKNSQKKIDEDIEIIRRVDGFLVVEENIYDDSQFLKRKKGDALKFTA